MPPRPQRGKNSAPDRAQGEPHVAARTSQREETVTQILRGVFRGFYQAHCGNCGAVPVRVPAAARTKSSSASGRAGDQTRRQYVADSDDLPDRRVLAAAIGSFAIAKATAIKQIPGCRGGERLISLPTSRAALPTSSYQIEGAGE